jgi:PAS domain S-box-containing protein
LPNQSNPAFILPNHFKNIVMGLFSFTKKSDQLPKPANQNGASKGVVAKSSSVPTAVSSSKPTADLKNGNSSTDKLKEFFMLQEKLKKLEKSYQLQTKELEEHEEYMRNIMNQLTDQLRQNKFQEGEIKEHEEYLRKLLESVSGLQKQNKFQEREINEHEEYTRKLLESYSDLQKQNKFQEREIKEHEDYTRKLLESYSNLDRKNKFQEREIKEHEDYTRNLLETYAKTKRQAELKEQEIAEQESYIRNIMEQLSDLQKKYRFAENEIKEQESHTRALLEQLNKAKQENKHKDNEIKELEQYLRRTMESLNDAQKNQITAPSGGHNHQVLSQDNSKIKNLENEIKEQEKYLRNISESYLALKKQLENNSNQATISSQLFAEFYPTVELDINGKILSANQAWQELNGYTENEVKGLKDIYFHYLEGIEKSKYDLMWEMLQNGKSYKGTFTKITKAEQIIKVQANYLPIVDQNNQLIKIFKTEEDLSTRHAEINYHETYQKTGSKLFPHVEINSNLDIVAVSESAIQLFGYQMNEFENGSFKMLIEKSFVYTLEFFELADTIRNGRKEQKLVKCITKDGTVFDTEITCTPVFDEFNRLDKILVFFNTNAQQLQLIAKFNSLQAINNEGVNEFLTQNTAYAEFDLSGNMLKCNDRYKKLFAIADADKQGFSFLSSFPLQYRISQEADRFWKSLLKADQMNAYPNRITKQGESFQITSYLKTVKNNAGEVVKIVEVINSQTESSKLENQYLLTSLNHLFMFKYGKPFVSNGMSQDEMLELLNFELAQLAENRNSTNQFQRFYP